jgi:hypothetical protein
MDHQSDSIVLIGPFGSGKSTLAELLSRRLRMPTESLDRHRDYYDDAGLDVDEFKRLQREFSLKVADRYYQSFFPPAIERLLATYPRHIIDLGAGHTVYEDKTAFERVRQALAPYPNVVLILPSPDADESVHVLRERAKGKLGGDYFLNSDFDYFAFWVKSHCNTELATITVYTEGKTPEETVDDLMRALRREG